MPAAAQQRVAALLPGTFSGGDNLPPPDGLAAEMPPPPPPGMFAFASGRSMQVSAAAQQRAAVLLTADAASDAELAGACAHDVRAQSPHAALAAGHVLPPPPPPGMFALASGRSMQISAAAQEHAAALLADVCEPEGPAATAAGSPGRSAGEAGPPAPPPAGVFALASGRSMQVSAAAQERAATLLADAGDAGDPDAAGKGSASGSGAEAGLIPPPPGMFAFASGRSMQVSTAAQERAATLLADVGEPEGPAAADKAAASGSGGEAGIMPPQPEGMFAFGRRALHAGLCCGAGARCIPAG